MFNRRCAKILYHIIVYITLQYVGGCNIILLLLSAGGRGAKTRVQSTLSAESRSWTRTSVWNWTIFRVWGTAARGRLWSSSSRRSWKWSRRRWRSKTWRWTCDPGSQCPGTGRLEHLRTRGNTVGRFGHRVRRATSKSLLLLFLKSGRERTNVRPPRRI